MPRVLPGVSVTVSDQSQVILTNNTVLFGAVGRFSQGNSTPVLVTNKQQFTNLFGSYNDTPDTGKPSYVGIANLLNSATGVYVSNVYTSAAKYAGQVVTSANKKSAVSSISDNTSYTFTTYTPTAVTGETVGTPNGVLVAFKMVSIKCPIQPTTVVIHATVNGQVLTFTDNGYGSLVDSTGTILDTSLSYVHYNTGFVYVKFNAGKAPDNSSALTMDYYWYSDSTSGGAVTGEVIGVGNGTSTLTFTGTLANTPIKPGSITLHATISSDRTAVDTPVAFNTNGTGKFVDATTTYYDTTLTNINYETGAYTVVMKAGEFPTGNVTVNYTYESVQMFAMLAKSPQTWANNYGITISNQDYDTNTFYINEYVTKNGTTTFIQSYLVSRDPKGVDGFGNKIYIQDIVNARSNFFVCVNNTSVNYQIIPQNNAIIFYNGGGVDSGVPASQDYATSITQFDSPNYAWDMFMGNGIVDINSLDEIATIVSDNYKFAMVDCQSSPKTSSALVTWANGLGIDEERMAFYAPNAQLSYNGSTVECPASSLVCERFANAVATSGNKFMPPAGVARGTVTVVSLDAYYADADILNLHGANINVIKNIRGYGNVIFSDFTMQSATTATSYINSVLTLNDMINTFKSSLITVNFKVINEITFLELRSLIDGYLSQLALKDGTIEPAYTIICDSTNNTAITKAARQIMCNVIFVFQGLAQNINLQLTYTTDALYATLV